MLSVGCGRTLTTLNISTGLLQMLTLNFEKFSFSILFTFLNKILQYINTSSSLFIILKTLVYLLKFPTYWKQRKQVVFFFQI